MNVLLEQFKNKYFKYLKLLLKIFPLYLRYAASFQACKTCGFFGTLSLFLVIKFPNLNKIVAILIF